MSHGFSSFSNPYLLPFSQPILLSRDEKKQLFQLVKLYLACQVARPQYYKRPNILQTTKLEPIPFTLVYWDVKGPMLASNSLKFVLAFLNATMRYVITVLLPAVTAETTADTLMRHLFFKK